MSASQELGQKFDGDALAEARQRQPPSSYEERLAQAKRKVVWREEGLANAVKELAEVESEAASL